MQRNDCCNRTKPMARHSLALVISPHIDDAFLSIAGCMIAGHVHDAVVVDVFGKSTYLRSRKGVTEREVFRIRCAEERAAALIAGAEAAHLAVPNSAL